MRLHPLISPPGLVLLCLLCLNAGTVRAAETHFRDIALDVPAQCKAAETNGAVAVVCPEGFFFVLEILPPGATASSSLSAALQSRKKGQTVMNDSGNLVYDSDFNGAPCRVESIHKGDSAMIFVSDMQDKEWPKYLRDCLESVRGNTEEINEFLVNYLLQ